MYFSCFFKRIDYVGGEGNTKRASDEKGTTGNYLVLSPKSICKYLVMSLQILRLENCSASEIECKRDLILCSAIPKPIPFK